MNEKEEKLFDTIASFFPLYTFLAINEIFNPYVSLFQNDTFLNLQSRLLSFPRVICLQVLKKLSEREFWQTER